MKYGFIFLTKAEHFEQKDIASENIEKIQQKQYSWSKDVDMTSKMNMIC